MTAVFRTNLPSALITGANRGLGLGLAKEFSLNGYNVFATSRKTGPADVKDLAPYAVAIHPLDLLDPSSIASLPPALSRHTPALHVLINNSGTMIPDKVGGLTPDSLLTQFKVNAMGPALVTQALVPHLEAAAARGDDGAKVVNVSAILASLHANVMPGKLPGYRASKTAQNALTLAMAKELGPKGIVVFGMHPGFVATRMSGNKGDLTVEQSAKLVAEVVRKADKAIAGKMVNQVGTVINW